MNATFDLKFTPADKRVWLCKFIASLISIMIFSITYYLTGDTNIAVAGLVAVAVFVAVFAAVARDAGAFVFAFMLAFMLTFARALAVEAWFRVIIIVTTAMLTTVLTILAILAAAAKNKNKEKYKITTFSDLISSIIQFCLTLLGLYLCLHLQIILTWAT